MGLAAWMVSGFHSDLGAAELTATTQQSSNPSLYDQIERCCQPIDGLQLHGSYTAEILGKVAGGQRRGSVYDGLGKVDVRFDLEKLCGWKGATAFVNALYPHGASLTQNYVGDLNVVSNIDAYDSARWNEIGIEQTFLEELFSIRLGELAADSEFFVCDSGALFISSSFGVLPLISLNYDAPVYPVAAPGARLQWKPSASFLVRAGIYGGDLGDQSRNNKHGGRLAFSADRGALLLAEAVYQTSTDNAVKRLSGSFKLGGFFHTGKFNTLEGSDGTQRGSGGFYAIVDQAITREHGDGKSSDQGLNLFARGGVAWPEVTTLVTSYVESGVTYKGLLPARHKDVCGLAFSYTHLGAEARDGSNRAAETHYETIFEATYQAVLSDWLTFQPEFQFIFNPGAASARADAAVVGARLMVNF